MSWLNLPNLLIVGLQSRDKSAVLVVNTYMHGQYNAKNLHKNGIWFSGETTKIAAMTSCGINQQLSLWTSIKTLLLLAFTNSC